MSKKNPTVSIITITQYKRAGCLKILKDIIKDQTYKNIIEWVLVEGSPTKEDSEKNEKHIQELISQNDLGFTETLTNPNSRYVMLNLSMNIQKWTGAVGNNNRPLIRRGDGSFMN
jgi:hypothetical protein